MMGAFTPVTASGITGYVLQENGCWTWVGHHGRGGYGRISVRKKAMQAHRYIYEQRHGPIPAGKALDHLCRNRDCVNPAHLEPVTCRENLLRGETLAAANAAKTVCTKGHEYSEDNTYFLAAGYNERKCRTCRNNRDRRRRERERGGRAPRSKWPYVNSRVAA